VIEVVEHADGCVLPVRAQPGARKAGVLGEQAGALRVAVTAPPEQGRANKALAAVLREALGVKRSQVELLHGATSRDKRFLIRGVSRAELLARLAVLLQRFRGKGVRRMDDSERPTDPSSARPIYLDYNATTPVDPPVLAAMLPFLGSARFEGFGNPSSNHAYGRAAREAVERARAQVAALIGAQPDEIVFTGGGSEASNLALKGVVFARLRGLFGRWARGAHIITSAVEHPATLQPCAFLERLGCRVTVLPVDRHGRVDPDAVRKALDRPAILVSIMHSNNEVGTLQPVREIAALARERGVPVHTDVAQSLGKLPVDVNELGVDLLSIAGHKLYAPKGVGALYVRRGLRLEPLVHGAGHEGGRRAGTENVPYLVGLGQACELARRSLPAATEHLRRLRDRLWQRLRVALGDRIALNGHPELRLPNTLNISFLSHVGAELLERVPGVAASTGSACHEGRVTVSPVLAAMGVPAEQGRGAVRLSVGRFTSEEDVDRAAELFRQALATKG
jgi:cysteine desulfurase